jgi:hypothetical protein
MISINPPSSLQSAACRYYAQLVAPFQDFDKNCAVAFSEQRNESRDLCARRIDISLQVNRYVWHGAISVNRSAASQRKQQLVPARPLRFAGLDIRCRRAIFQGYTILSWS